MELKIQGAQGRLVIKEPLMAVYAAKACQQLAGWIEQGELDNVMTLILDVTAVEIIDSLGVKLILQAHRYACEAEKHFHVEVGPHPVARALSQCQLDQIIPIREVQTAQ